MTIHGKHPFPNDIEELLRRVDELSGPDRYPLGYHWPFSPQEFGWEEGKDLDEARKLLSNLIEMLEVGRGDEVLIDPRTGKPLASKS